MARNNLVAKAFPNIVSIGLKRAPFADFYHQVLVSSWWQFFLLSSVAFVGINAVFGVLYWISPGCITGAREGSYEDAFFFSVQTLGTIGYGSMSPYTRYGHIIVTIEALVGILSVALITGLTFAKFARPSARVLFSARIAAPTRYGVPHLQFRMANQRQNMVVEARLQITVLVVEITPEGESTRRPIEVKLVRPNTPLFALTWTAMHVIDENSPFFGGPDSLPGLKKQGAEIFLALTAYDETVAQSIYVRQRYTLDDIAWGTRFQDVLTTKPDGTRIVDYTHFHEVVPINQQPSAAAPKAVEDFTKP